METRGPKCNLPVLITNFDNDLIKNEGASMEAPSSHSNEVAINSKTFSESMGQSRVGNYHANSPNCIKIEHVEDFISVPIICKFEDPINNVVAIIQTTFSQ